MINSTIVVSDIGWLYLEGIYYMEIDNCFIKERVASILKRLLFKGMRPQFWWSSLVLFKFSLCKTFINSFFIDLTNCVRAFSMYLELESLLSWKLWKKGFPLPLTELLNLPSPSFPFSLLGKLAGALKYNRELVSSFVKRVLILITSIIYFFDGGTNKIFQIKLGWI